MIRDYRKYELEGKEKTLFLAGGYGCIFLVVYLFYHSIWLSAGGTTGVLFAALCGTTSCGEADESADGTVPGSALFLVGVRCGRTVKWRKRW